MPETTVTGYQLIDLIGRGASSEVYKARHMKTGRIVALKVVKRGSADSGRHFRQIATEFRVASRWTHPNLVRLDELVTTRFLLWKFQMALAMEYVPGEMLKGGHGLTGKEIVSYYMQLCEGMHYMHQQGYIHLDMKPQNVIVTPDGKAKIMDFGLCTRKGRYNPRVQGTPDFMAPEQLRRGWVDERTDVYNLGATIFYAVTGKSVQGMLTSRTRSDDDVSVMTATFHSLNVEVPPDFESLILQCCRSSPAERPATMQRVLEKLESIQKQITK